MILTDFQRGRLPYFVTPKVEAGDSSAQKEGKGSSKFVPADVKELLDGVDTAEKIGLKQDLTGLKVEPDFIEEDAAMEGDEVDIGEDVAGEVGEDALLQSEANAVVKTNGDATGDIATGGGNLSEEKTPDIDVSKDNEENEEQLLTSLSAAEKQFLGMENESEDDGSVHSDADSSGAVQEEDSDDEGNRPPTEVNYEFGELLFYVSASSNSSGWGAVWWTECSVWNTRGSGLESSQ